MGNVRLSAILRVMLKYGKVYGVANRLIGWRLISLQRVGDSVNVNGRQRLILQLHLCFQLMRS